MGVAVKVITVLRQQYRPTARTAPFKPTFLQQDSKLHLQCQEL